MPTTLQKTTVEEIRSLVQAQPRSSYVPAAKTLLEAWLKEPGLSMSDETRSLINETLREIG